METKKLEIKKLSKAEEEILVSIIVPTYNVEKYAGKCFQSLINQTLKNIEIILVDDGSTDSSGRICDEFEKIDNRVVVIHQKNVGLGLSRNSGIRIARGKYIGFVDSDDFVSEKMFELLYVNAEKYNANISYCSYSRFSDENEINIANEKEVIEVFEGEKELSDYLLKRIGMPPESHKDKLFASIVWNGIFSRELINNNNLLFVSEREFISEDIIFDIDVISKVNCIIHSNQKMYFYRVNKKSLTQKYDPERFEKNVILYNEVKRKMELLYSKEGSFNSISRYLITTARVAIIQEVSFEKENGIMNSINNIKNICNNEVLQTILNEYNYQLLPKKYSITCYLIKNKNAGLLWLIYNFYNIKKLIGM